MFTQETRDRFKRAGEYQRKAGEYQLKAILELIPDGTEEHLCTIGKEMKEMFEETFEGIAKEFKESFEDLKKHCEDAKSEEDSEKTADEADDADDDMVKKVVIE